MLANDFIVSWIRTIVPTATAAFGTWVASKWGLQIDTVGLAAFVVTVFLGVYYAAVRWLARKFPWMERLLGVKATPTYGPSGAGTFPT